MRIIAGKYRGSKLFTLPGLNTRPTLDRTKEAIFSHLGNYLPPVRVLDLFGGSGALSLESLSRGAKQAYIIESNPEAVKIIKRNAEKLKVSSSELVIFQSEYQKILPRLVGKETFDLILLDPPFRMKVIEEIITYVLKHKLLADGGYIVAEYPIEDVVQKEYPELTVTLCRRYSSSEVLILKKE